ncbi:substrate-binding domain-containing protein [Sodalis sp. dw_96]|uniref:substrate-binding domain-containing protein n=1 Tax=Sodalis sp. dw_96 TaxID=2719794 RepID=UPI001BD415BA|nr:substrate-binding domain-containing protein [Sodalis sp. dw_96]
MKDLYIKSAGAARGLIESTCDGFSARRQFRLVKEFAAVGTTFDRARQAMSEHERCDLVALTPDLLHRLGEEFPQRIAPAGSLGFTPTCLACRPGVEPVDISTVNALRRAISDVEVIFTGDLRQSTIGRHTVYLLKSLGLDSRATPDIVEFPGGAQAVAAIMATEKSVLAIAQLTELRLHPSAILVGPLPAEYYLATEYALGVVDDSPAAWDYAALLTGLSHEETRRQCGFNPL